MNQSISCTFSGHEGKEIIYVCLSQKCQLSRLLCSYCLLDNNHKHGQNDNNHIVDHQRLETVIQQKIEHLIKLKTQDYQESCHFIQQSIKAIQSILESILGLMDLLKDFQDDSFYSLKIKTFDQKLNDLRQNKLNNMDNQFLGELVWTETILSREPQINKVFLSTEVLKANSSKIQNLFQQFKKNDTQRQIQKIKDAKYEIFLIDQVSKKNIDAVAISQDLKQVASATEQFLKIWNYSSDYSKYKLFQEKVLNEKIIYIKFTEDSKLLYVGMNGGELISFDVGNNFQLNYIQKIHDQRITSLFCITNIIVLTSSVDGLIIKTNISLNKQLYKIQTHTEETLSRDYDRWRDIVVSCHSRRIQLWNNSDGSLFTKKIALLYPYRYAFRSALFLGNDQLIVLQSESFCIYQLNYEKNIQINFRGVLFHSYGIFQVVQNYQLIIYVFEDYLYLYTYQGNLIRKIKHDISISDATEGIQLHQSRSIIIKGSCKLLIKQKSTISCMQNRFMIQRTYHQFQAIFQSQTYLKVFQYQYFQLSSKIQYSAHYMVQIIYNEVSVISKILNHLIYFALINVSNISDLTKIPSTLTEH